MYIPYFAEQLNIAEGTSFPLNMKLYNNYAFSYWCRSLCQRAQSVLDATLPEEWSAERKNFLYYCLFRYGFVTCWKDAKYGTVFQPSTLSGYDFYYQPVNALIANPHLPKSLELKIGEKCELLKLAPDYQGIWDIIVYYAEKLAGLDSALNMSIVNNKLAFVLFGKTRAAAEAIKKILDKINRGEAAVVADMKLVDDAQSKDTPFQFLERSNLKQSYLTTDQLMDMQTILNSFDAEIGIPTVPYQKKERMVTSEADSKMIDSSARLTVWLDCLNESAKKVNALLGTDIAFKAHYEMKGGDSIVDNETDSGRM